MTTNDPHTDFVTHSDTQSIKDNAIIPWKGNQAKEATGMSPLEPPIRRTSRTPQWLEK